MTLRSQSIEDRLPFMRGLLRHTWSVGVLAALVMVGLLHGQLAGRVQASPFQSRPDTGTTTPSPHPQDTGPHHAVPLSATVPVAHPKQPLDNVLEGTALSKGTVSEAVPVASASARAFLSSRLARHTTALSRFHLFCVYRL